MRVVLVESQTLVLVGLCPLIEAHRHGVVILTSMTGGQHVRRALRHGASGFIAKEAERACGSRKQDQ